MLRRRVDVPQTALQNPVIVNGIPAPVAKGGRRNLARNLSGIGAGAPQPQLPFRIRPFPALAELPRLRQRFPAQRRRRPQLLVALPQLIMQRPPLGNRRRQIPSPVGTRLPRDFIQRPPAHSQRKARVIRSNESRTPQPEMRPAPARLRSQQVKSHLCRHKIIIQLKIAAAGAFQPHHLPVVQKMRLAGRHTQYHMLRPRLPVPRNPKTRHQPGRMARPAGKGPPSAYPPPAGHRLPQPARYHRPRRDRHPPAAENPFHAPVGQKGPQPRRAGGVDKGAPPCGGIDVAEFVHQLQIQQRVNLRPAQRPGNLQRQQPLAIQRRHRCPRQRPPGVVGLRIRFQRRPDAPHRLQQMPPQLPPFRRQRRYALPFQLRNFPTRGNAVNNVGSHRRTSKIRITP